MQKAAGHDEHEYIKQKIHVDKSKWKKNSTVILTAFYIFNVSERMKMQSAAPSLFVGLSSADRDALGEDYMAKIS